MIESVRTFFRNIPKHIWILALIILVGIFFRMYHFDDWLPFKGDGFRDATLISNVYRVGPEGLPLLGPRAAGTMLRLGPAFYHFQYASAVLFDSISAPILAYPDLFFSILAIPVFYLFSRRYFGIPWALTLSGMLSVSFLAIEYGRFAWNPNATVFFVLVFSLSVLKVFDAESPGAPKRRFLWAALAGAAFAIASQLHFSSFLGLPIVLAAFLLWQWRETRRSLSLQVISFFLATILLIYTPVFMSEYFKHGENSKRFISALSSKPSVHGPAENFVEAVKVFANQNARITVGLVYSSKKILFFSALFLAVGFLANAFLLRGEQNASKRRFLQWTLLLMGAYFILYLPLAFTVNRSRFFLPFMMVPYIYCGYIILALEKRFGRHVFLKALAILGAGIVIMSNTHSVVGWFSELHQSERVVGAAEMNERNDRGRKSFWLVWTHFDKAATAMDSACPGDTPIFFFPSKEIKEYGRSIEYPLLLKNPDRPIILERKYDLETLEGCYFFVSHTQEDTVPESMRSERMDAPLNLGGILVTQFYPARMSGSYEPDEDDEKEMTFVPEKRTKNSRVYWGDVVNLITGEK